VSFRFFVAGGGFAVEPVRTRLAKILTLLKKAYPETKIALNFKNAYELIVATVLSAQCTDEVVNRVTPAVFKKYPSPAKLAGAELPEVERMIHSTGFFRNKAKSLVGMAQNLQSRFKGEVPHSMSELLTLPGVARKTANVVLGSAYGINEGIVVDTHVKRVSQRLGVTSTSDPVQIEKDLMSLLPRKDWHGFSVRLVFHGRRLCQAKKPACAVCSLNRLCPSAIPDPSRRSPGAKPAAD
jgi:endonuclease-3